MSTFEENLALKDVQDVVKEFGTAISFEANTEAGEIKRGRYGGIKQIDPSSTATKYSIKAFPINNSPNRKDIDKAGLKEMVDTVIYTSILDWRTLSVKFDDIDIVRFIVVIEGARFTIKEKAQVSQFGNSFLYWTFGLMKK